MEELKDLIREFDDEKGFYETVRTWFYTIITDTFKDEVEECCKIVIFGYEYAMSVQEIYDYDREAAVEAWRHHVSRMLDDFHESWMEWSIRYDIDVFANEFQQWLASQDDERTSNVIVALMSGDIDLSEAVADWLYDRLCYEDWNYPPRGEKPTN